MIDPRHVWDPAVLSLSAEAFRLYWSSLCYCDVYAPDSLLSASALTHLRARPKQTSEIISAGLWQQLEGCTRVRHHADQEAARLEMDLDRQGSRERTRVHRDKNSKATGPPAPALRNVHVTPESRLHERDSGVTEASQAADPSRPPHTPPTPPNGSNPSDSGVFSGSDSDHTVSSSGVLTGSARVAASKRKPKRAKWRRVPVEWQPSLEHAQLADEEGVDLAREESKFRDWEFRTPRQDADATFRRWLREAGDRQRRFGGGRALVRTNPLDDLFERSRRMTEEEAKNS